jgi:hypothetical protein
MFMRLSERKYKLNLASGFLNDLKVMRLYLKSFIKAQKAQKCDAVNALQHASKTSPTPGIVVGNDWRFTHLSRTTLVLASSRIYFY